MKTYLITLAVFCSFLALPSHGLSQEPPEKTIWDAASDGDVEAIEAHIAAETDLDEQNETGYAPLHYGVMKTKPGVVALLLEAGADPDVVNNQSKTPLDLAISGAKDEIIDLLLEAGAAVEPPADGMQLAVALLIISFVLMFFEVLLPGMVLGACAVLSLFASVAVAYSNTDHGNIFLIIALVSLAVFAVGFVYWFPKSYMGRNLTSTSTVGDLGIDLSELINKTGSAYTNLRPSGTAVIGDDRVDVVTEGTFVEKDRPVKVVAVEGQRVVVREVEFLT